MDGEFYILGIIFAILAGCTTNIGLLLQKKVVNQVPDDAKLMKTLIKNKLWLLGIILEFGIGSIFFILTQSFLGPALVPGLMASGLIILALGSIKILGETLKKEEIIGIILMIVAIFLLGFSGLLIEIIATNLFEFEFLVRISIYTITIFLASILCEFIQRKNKRLKGISLATLSGLMYSISNFWISILIALFEQVIFGPREIILLAIASILLILTNILAISKIQEAFRVGNASNLIPIQQIPIQITPVFMFFLVYLLEAPGPLSFVFLIIAIIFIIISSFLLGKRQAQLEEIK